MWREPSEPGVLQVSLLFLSAVLSLLYSSAWLTGYEHPVIETINQRIEDLTGLEVDTAEELQVSTGPPRAAAELFSPHQSPGSSKDGV